MTELSRYVSHKTVEAMKIKKIAAHPNGDYAALWSQDEGEGPIRVGPEYLAKHKPQIGGYYVKYADGYESWSPAEAFESGYERIADPPVPFGLHPSTFEYLKPAEEQLVRMSSCRAAFADCASAIELFVPSGPDRTYLLRKLRECGMWANVAITRHADGSPRT